MKHKDSQNPQNKQLPIRVFAFQERLSIKAKLLLWIFEFADGEMDLRAKPKSPPPRRPTQHQEATISQRFNQWHSAKAQNLFKGMYNVASTAICIGVISMLLITVSYLPPHGGADNPVNNEVSQRYIEDGVAETGAVNAVSGMILDYRAFDTFGESAVLFVAIISVVMFLQNPRIDGEKQINPDYKPMTPDPIVKMVAKYLIPFLLIFGVYIVLNGHISPGGGFAGGAIMGSSLILYSAAYGYEVVGQVLTEKLVKRCMFSSLSFYACAKGYSFFTGANHLETGIPLGTAGDILSAGLILPLNIAVGCIVTCTMYSFYSLFSKGEV